jgi:lysophospholipase L1-like esterase
MDGIMTYKILCFGDSNTWGYVPGTWDEATGSYEQYEPQCRWPIILEKALAEEKIKATIVDDSQPGRTVNIEHDDAPELNGMSVFKRKHLANLAEFGVVIIALGINDLKSTYKKTGGSVAEDLVSLVRLIKKNSPSSEVIIPLPPKINKEDGFGSDFLGAAKKSDDLRKKLMQLSQKNSFHVLRMAYDLNEIDGIHFSLNDNKNIANHLKNLILTL